MASPVQLFMGLKSIAIKVFNEIINVSKQCKCLTAFKYNK